MLITQRPCPAGTSPGKPPGTPPVDRRMMLGGLATGLASLTVPRGHAQTVGQAAPATADGHAAGLDVAPSATFNPLVPRRPGEAAAFTASLDKAAIKATSGGWAREVTARQLPLATRIAGAHLYLNPGGAREMHWHNSAEWAVVLGGTCQVTAMDANGEMEVANFGPGDLWYFPPGHAHAIQTLGDAPCHAILVFNDGLYAEHGTFGITDVLSRVGRDAQARHLGLPEMALAAMPPGETYIAQGIRLPAIGPEAQAARPLDPSRTHRYRLDSTSPWFEGPGGTIRLASSEQFPLSADMTGIAAELQPGALHVFHWHPNADEWLYVTRGSVVVTVLLPDKHLAQARLEPGDCAYIPANCAHSLGNEGRTAASLVGALNSGAYQECSLSSWVAGAPAHLLANNLGLAPGALAHLQPGQRLVIASL